MESSGFRSRPNCSAVTTVLRLLRVDEGAEKQVKERNVDLERGLLWVDQVLHCKADVERDHRRCDLVWRQGRFAPDLLEGGLDLLSKESPVAAPEARRELPEVLVPGGLGQALEPEAEEPVGALVFLDVADALGPPPEALPRAPWLGLRLLRQFGIALVNAGMQQFDEELVLAIEVGVEGAAGKAGLCCDVLDA